MSLVAHILFSRETCLPVGNARTHIVEPWDDEEQKRPASVYFRPHCGKKKADNIERVFAAISSGAHTAVEIMVATGLSKVTTAKALHQLEAWPTGPRILRELGRSNRADRFEATS